MDPSDLSHLTLSIIHDSGNLNLDVGQTQVRIYSNSDAGMEENQPQSFKHKLKIELKNTQIFEPHHSTVCLICLNSKA